MALRYTELQSSLKVVTEGDFTLTGAATDHVAIIDLTASPYGHGVHSALFVMQGMSLSNAATLTAIGNTAANATGTDTVLATMAIAASDTNACLEIPGELLGHFSDRAAAGTQFKSLVFALAGDTGDTIKRCYVVKAMQRQDGLTPSDSTTVT